MHGRRVLYKKILPKYLFCVEKDTHKWRFLLFSVNKTNKSQLLDFCKAKTAKKKIFRDTPNLNLQSNALAIQECLDISIYKRALKGLVFVQKEAIVNQVLYHCWSALRKQNKKKDVKVISCFYSSKLGTSQSPSWFSKTSGTHTPFSCFYQVPVPSPATGNRPLTSLTLTTPEWPQQSCWHESVTCTLSHECRAA